MLLALCLLPVAAACAGPDDPPRPGPTAAPRGTWREQIHWVEARTRSGDPHLLYTRVCQPPGEQPAPVVLINHGTPPRAGDRPTRRPVVCENEAAQWFLRRGYLVVAGMRRGHGPSTGAFAESSSGCSADGFIASARAAADDIEALVAFAATLPRARPDGMVMVGQSTGGWSTIGYNTRAHPRVRAMVNMAGGRGGHYNQVPHNNCRPDQLVLAAGRLGRAATTPMLWVYTENDSYFGPTLAREMHRAFTQGGGRADLVQLGGFAEDGHTLFFGRGGSAIWGPLVERYLESR